ncbi:glycosyltransferase family 2 protein [Flavobacteriaceae bacterium S356]|uniref:Glycosyltransferase family 2 protein n=1 Tax=Asprobacillus argus TaxID=3076534 RepID=A0ABU3LHY9_9FLAO|nr:glycosyltransferase family 2 protein [Flavobacteriaceae bacterium S356]
MTKKPSNTDVSIIIVNYKSWRHLKNCLEAFKTIQSEVFSFEIIVVDNHSNDGMLDTFSLAFPNVNFKVNIGNNGFANGCNFGAKHAQGEYLFFLNPDTIANEDAIHKLLDFARLHHTVGIVSCHQKNHNGSYEKTERLFPSLFTLFGLTRAIYKKGNQQKIQKQYDKHASMIYPDWVSGSVVFMSRKWFDQIQGWNEDYWMYYEDVDICKRVQEANGKIALLQDVEIIHNHGGASRINVKTASITKTEVLISKHVYINNHFKGIDRFLSQLLLVLSNIIFKTVLGIVGLIFFFIPKLRLILNIYLKLVKYYIKALFKGTWLSKRSLNY